MPIHDDIATVARWARTILFGPALLAGCGDTEAGSSPPIVTVPASTPITQATPAPNPTPTPTSTPSGVVEPYVLGSLSYTLAADTPPEKVATIRDAMDFAVAHTNVLAAYDGTISVVFGAGTPTADASFQGQIRFGGSIGRRVALHELSHWLGSGSAWQWSSQVSDGRFNGSSTTARIKAFDGPDAFLHADGQHFWPYGLNYDNEFSETQRTTQLVSAQRVDMGLGTDATAAIAGVRRFHNRAAQLVLQGASGTRAPIEAPNAAGPAQQWRVTYADGFIMLANAQTGLSIEATAQGDDAAAVMAAASTSTRQQWEMMPVGDGGWFLLRNRATGNCLDNIGNLAAGAAVRLWSCGFHPNQQWQLVR